MNLSRNFLSSLGHLRAAHQPGSTTMLTPHNHPAASRRLFPDFFNLAPYPRPAVRRKHQKGQISTRKVLLIFEILIRGDKRIENTLSASQQLSVLYTSPALF